MLPLCEGAERFNFGALHHWKHFLLRGIYKEGASIQLLAAC